MNSIWHPLCLFTQIKTFFLNIPVWILKIRHFYFFYRPDHDSNSHQIPSWLNKIMFGSNVKLHDKERSTKDMEHYELAKSFCFLNFTRTN